MNIVFTDIDGVLFPTLDKNWNKNSINIYNKICEEFNLKTIITSSWRINHTLDELKDILSENGIKSEIIGCTKNLNSDRGLEIKQWLLENECDNFIIIDDMVYNITPHINKNVIKCRGWVGLSEKEYLEIRELLKSNY